MEGEGSAAPPEVQKPSLLERYGTAAVITILGLFALEMIVLVPLVRFGVDLGPLTRWLQATFGVAVATEPGAPVSWWLSAGVAYAITRPLKPIQLAVAALLTPLVARVLPGAR